MDAEQLLFERLKQLGIAWQLHEHDAVFTVEESVRLHESIAGAHTKNLFLKDAGGQFWLVTVPHDARVDLKALPAAIGSKKVSFGKPDDMERLLAVTPGSVTPLAAMNDVSGEVHVVLDSRLASEEWVHVHPLRNTATLGLSGPDLLRFLASFDHDAAVLLVPAPQ